MLTCSHFRSQASDVVAGLPISGRRRSSNLRLPVMDGDAPINLSGDEGGDEEVESVANKPEVLSDAKATKASKNTAQRKQTLLI
ncbi:hypothetical protein L2E82_31820 [Cichorium intybus]|uniref:Uncharacterized protein n=1 Tax=Cichorium intybus TaxID=13427 RepID=A0ACB9BFT5_CICIN|nr:hypothetical protein L2E82_31820 [Cichorium intybus]